MPELPDVQVFKEYLDATSLHREVASVHVADDRVLEDVSRQGLARRLDHRSLASTRRRGKWLFAEISGDAGWLVLHFGMTGSLEAWEGDGDPPEYAQVRIDFTDGRHLAFLSKRKLGRVGLTDDPDGFLAGRDVGPDVLGVDREDFVEALSDRRGTLEGALMDQSLFAGIGNEYSDEILFQAGLHPETEVADLDEDRLGEVYDTVRDVLETAIDARVDPSKMPDGWMLPHRHGDGKCPKCGEELEKDDVVGRTAYYCPNDQEKPRARS